MIDQVRAMNRIREVIASVADFERVYAQSADDDHALPDAVNEFPAVIVMKGQTREHIVTQPQERLTYEVRVLVLTNRMADVSSASAQLLPLNVAIRRAFNDNITLGGRVNWVKVDRDTGFTGIEWGGIEYVGEELTMVVSEQGSTGGVESGY